MRVTSARRSLVDRWSGWIGFGMSMRRAVALSMPGIVIPPPHVSYVGRGDPNPTPIGLNGSALAGHRGLRVARVLGMPPSSIQPARESAMALENLDRTQWSFAEALAHARHQ